MVLGGPAKEPPLHEVFKGEQAWWVTIQFQIPEHSNPEMFLKDAMQNHNTKPSVWKMFNSFKIIMYIVDHF